MQFRPISEFDKTDRFDDKGVKVNDGRRQFLAFDGRRFHVVFFETANHPHPRTEGGNAIRATKWAELPSNP